MFTDLIKLSETVESSLSLGRHDKMPFISHHSGGWGVHDQGAAQSPSQGAPSSCLVSVASLLCPHLVERGSSGTFSSSYEAPALLD